MSYENKDFLSSTEGRLAKNLRGTVLEVGSHGQKARYTPRVGGMAIGGFDGFLWKDGQGVRSVSASELKELARRVA